MAIAGTHPMPAAIPAESVRMPAPATLLMIWKAVGTIPLVWLAPAWSPEAASSDDGRSRDGLRSAGRGVDELAGAIRASWSATTMEMVEVRRMGTSVGVRLVAVSSSFLPLPFAYDRTTPRLATPPDSAEVSVYHPSSRNFRRGIAVSAVLPSAVIS